MADIAESVGKNYLLQQKPILRSDEFIICNIGKLLDTSIAIIATNYLNFAFRVLSSHPSNFSQVVLPDNLSLEDKLFLSKNINQELGVTASSDLELSSGHTGPVSFVADFLDLDNHSNIFDLMLYGNIEKSVLILNNCLYSSVREFLYFAESSLGGGLEFYPTNGCLAILHLSKEHLNNEHARFLWNRACEDSKHLGLKVRKQANGFFDNNKTISPSSDSDSEIIHFSEDIMLATSKVLSEFLNYLEACMLNLGLQWHVGENKLDASLKNHDISKPSNGFKSWIKKNKAVLNIFIDVVLNIESLRQKNIAFDCFFLERWKKLESALAITKKSIQSDGSIFLINKKNYKWLNKILNQQVIVYTLIFELRKIAFWSQNWVIENNLTWKAILSKNFVWNAARPLPLKPNKEYSDFYEFQGLLDAGKKKYAADNRHKPIELQRTLALGDNLNHLFRRFHIANMIENLFAILGKRYPDDTIGWLDIGCGSGEIANAVNPQKIINNSFEITGVDVGLGKIERANGLACKNREFVCSAGENLQKTFNGKKFHLITAFELLEHLLDPLSFLKLNSSLCTDFFIIASPLQETLSFMPNRAHIWSFARTGFEGMFEDIGFKVIYSSEVRVGTYLGGLDWLAVIATRHQGLSRFI
ncbi:hypothetical protein HW44_03635 [Nitrosococcus oceani]|nr:hypothetical protein HW44_03635 [Nitrosococcus oceani]